MSDFSTAISLDWCLSAPSYSNVGSCQMHKSIPLSADRQLYP